MRDNSGVEVRINRFLSAAGICSRREADKLVADGRVRIGREIAQPGSKVKPGQEVFVDGTRISGAREELLLAVNKPVGVVCTTDRRWGDPVLEDLIDLPDRVFAVGRLDKASEGLILMTNNGDLVNRLLKKSGGHEKEYLVRVDRDVPDNFLASMRRGVYLTALKRKTLPCKVERISGDTFRIILTQGLNRQIRRMCEELGANVVSLKRIRIMNITLGSLEPGKFRKLTPGETAELKRKLAAPGKRERKPQ